MGEVSINIEFVCTFHPINGCATGTRALKEKPGLDG